MTCKHVLIRQDGVTLCGQRATHKSISHDTGVVFVDALCPSHARAMAAKYGQENVQRLGRWELVKP